LQAAGAEFAGGARLRQDGSFQTGRDETVR
jgi:hypothetical protein